MYDDDGYIREDEYDRYVDYDLDDESCVIECQCGNCMECLGLRESDF